MSIIDLGTVSWLLAVVGGLVVQVVMRVDGSGRQKGRGRCGAWAALCSCRLEQRWKVSWGAARWIDEVEDLVETSTARTTWYISGMSFSQRWEPMKSLMSIMQMVRGATE
jgi:hypothetical protein